jgi:hypothetical protein
MFWKGGRMKKTRFSEEQIIGALKAIASGRTAADVARQLGVSKHIIYVLEPEVRPDEQ